MELILSYSSNTTFGPFKLILKGETHNKGFQLPWLKCSSCYYQKNDVSQIWVNWETRPLRANMNIYIMLVLVYINNGLQTSINVFLELRTIRFSALSWYCILYHHKGYRSTQQPLIPMGIFWHSRSTDLRHYHTSRLFNPAWSSEHDY